MASDFNSLVSGALLHDIGKLIQRSENQPFDKTHGQWGYDWLTTNKLFENDFAVNAVITHHFKDEGVFQSNYGLIWYEADNLASSERKQEEDKEKGKWEMFTPLASPFFRVRNPINLKETLPEIPYLQLKRTTGVESVSFKKPDLTPEAYKAIRYDLEKDFKIAEQYKPFSINLVLMLFEKHLSNVPSITLEIFKGQKEETQKHPDVSLFNHCKLTAAIAGCMHHYYKETYPDKWNNNELLKDEILRVSKDIKPYLLIGGDISGVQKFIYTITSKGALKSLKGRSFFLELLSEHFISELLEALHITRCNIIFSGGGHFYILSHNTPSAKKAINNIRTKTDEYLFNEFKGNLQLFLEQEEFHPDSFKNASSIWTGLSDKLEQAKKRKWNDRMEEILKTEMPHRDCLTKSCEVCFREDLPLTDLKSGEDILQVCEPCHNQYHLGEMLKGISRGEYPVIYEFAENTNENTVRIMDSNYLVKKGWDKDIHPTAKAVYRINDLTAKHYSHPNSVYLPIGIYQHDKLHELTDASSVFGINRIAVLRMDVDNLGKIFSQAVHEDDRTFSRMASISKGLNNFFKYHLNDIVEGKEIPVDIGERDVNKNGRMLSIVYSGGDDLFLIGHWLDITEAAFDINEYFRKYTGNPFITISGGIAVNHEKYPVYQYARDAKEAEDLAKKGSKDAVTLFGNRRFRWDDAKKVLDRVRLFKQFLILQKDYLAIDENKLPKTFFYRLLALTRRFKEDGTLILPKAAYLISRAKTDKCKPEYILELKRVIMNNNQDEWKITEAAAMWTLMLMRKGGTENA